MPKCRRSAYPSRIDSKADASERQAIPADLLADFEGAVRRPLRQRVRYAFIKTHKPVLDDAPVRAFDTTADYQRWCKQNLPESFRLYLRWQARG